MLLGGVRSQGGGGGGGAGGGMHSGRKGQGEGRKARRSVRETQEGAECVRGDCHCEGANSRATAGHSRMQRPVPGRRCNRRDASLKTVVHTCAKRCCPENDRPGLPVDMQAVGLESWEEHLPNQGHGAPQPRTTMYGRRYPGCCHWQ